MFCALTGALAVERLLWFGVKLAQKILPIKNLAVKVAVSACVCNSSRTEKLMRSQETLAASAWMQREVEVASFVSGVNAHSGRPCAK